MSPPVSTHVDSFVKLNIVVGLDCDGSVSLSSDSVCDIDVCVLMLVVA